MRSVELIRGQGTGQVDPYLQVWTDIQETVPSEGLLRQQRAVVSGGNYHRRVEIRAIVLNPSRAFPVRPPVSFPGEWPLPTPDPGDQLPPVVPDARDSGQGARWIQGERLLALSQGSPNVIRRVDQGVGNRSMDPTCRLPSE